MGFAVSVVPLETNTGYINLRDLDYPTFSEWFNAVKLQFNKVDNFSELKSDRLDALNQQGQNVLLLSLCDKGYNLSTQPSMLVKGSTPDSSYRYSVEIPAREDGESTVDLTKRWIGIIQEKVKEAISTLGLRINWVDYSFDDSDSTVTSPPELFPPSE